MKKDIKALLFGCIVVLSVFLLQLNCFAAANTIDLNIRGSITVEMRDPSTHLPVADGTLTLYKVADVYESGSGYDYILTGDFSQSGVDISDIDSPWLLFLLSDYVKYNPFLGTTVTIGNSGNAFFGNLSPGLYLVKQFDPAFGYYPVGDFLVSLPLHIGEEYLYDINATPKMELLKRTPIIPPPPPPPPSEDVPHPDEPSEHIVGERDASENYPTANKIQDEETMYGDTNSSSDMKMIVAGALLVLFAGILTVVSVASKNRKRLK